MRSPTSSLAPRAGWEAVGRPSADAAGPPPAPPATLRRGPTRRDARRARRVASRAAGGAVVAAALLVATTPALVALASAFSGDTYLSLWPQRLSLAPWSRFFAEPWLGAFVRSVAESVGAAAVACAVGLGAAVAVVRSPSRALRAAALSAALLPALVPAVALGVGALRAWGESGWTQLFLLHTALALPLGFFVQWGALRAVPRDLWDIATLSGATDARAVVAVIRPLVWRQTLLALVLATLFVYDETFVGLLTTTPDVATAAKLTYRSLLGDADMTPIVGDILLVLVAGTAIACLTRVPQRAR